ncbi:transmembrane protein 203-like protein [Leptotrombidium deliense]|uniref:Transmembrane protein 203-like protein n=1 Tax=Leptotrombidium deliense TaxID=299467 RepID=A0A443STQ0_9ACAR|nr:transmembrane protein 203-like protein [Leptotrombidium deliense]
MHLRLNLLYVTRTNFVCNRFAHKIRSYIDYSKVPELKEDDLEEKFISGWGPGGQKVNKAINAVFLKHIPTGLFVKVHEHRLLQKNQEIARELLKFKLDDFINGENSVSAQQRRHDEEKRKAKESAAAKRRELKKRFKESISVEKKSVENKLQAWLGVTLFEIFIVCVSFLIYTIVLTLKLEGVLQETSWWKIHTPLFMCDAFVSYFAVIVFIRLYLEGSYRIAFLRTLWSLNQILLLFAGKLLLCFKLENEKQITFSEVFATIFFLLLLLVIRACQLH